MVNLFVTLLSLLFIQIVIILKVIVIRFRDRPATMEELQKAVDIKSVNKPGAIDILHSIG